MRFIEVDEIGYDNRVLWRKVGRVRRLIGFKFRVIAKGPVTLSGLSIRVT
jgi:hypothetical protein